MRKRVWWLGWIFRSVQDDKEKGKSRKNNDDEGDSDDSDSDSDILDPYSCPEFGEKFDELYDFSDHFKQVHNV